MTQIASTRERLTGVRSIGSLLLLALTITLGLPSSGAKADWQTYQGDAAHTSYVPTTVSQIVPLWNTHVTNSLRLGMVADGNTVVLTSSGGRPNVHALDAQTGSIRWQASLNGRVAAPAMADGIVYIENSNSFIGYDAPTGATVFSKSKPTQGQIFPSPTPYQGDVYFGGGLSGDLQSIDGLTGAQNWTSPLGFPSFTGWTPSVDERFVYYHPTSAQVAIPGFLVIVDRLTGETVGGAVDPYADGSSSAVVLGPDHYAYTTGSGRLTAWDTSGVPNETNTPAVRWSLPNGAWDDPALAKGNLYIKNGTTGSLDVLDALTGDFLWGWHPPAASSVLDTFVITDNVAFVTVGHPITSSRQTFAIDLTTHSSIWSVPFGGDLALADGKLFISAADAVYAYSVVPEPTTMGLLSLGLAMLTPLTMRRFRACRAITAADR